jgi:hypothetical protein
MSRHLHARQRPRRVLAAVATVARDWWKWANQRTERRDVFAHIPQAPDDRSPRDEWADRMTEANMHGLALDEWDALARKAQDTSARTLREETR